MTNLRGEEPTTTFAVPPQTHSGVRGLVTRIKGSVSAQIIELPVKLDDGARFLVRAWCDPDNRLPSVIVNKRSWALGLQLSFIALLCYAIIDCVYMVDVGQEGVHLRLGRFNHVTQPGLNFQMPFGIDEVVFVNTQFIVQEEFGYRSRIEQGEAELVSVAPIPAPDQGDQEVLEVEAEKVLIADENKPIPLPGHPDFLKSESQMLTGNLNIVFISWAMQYEIVDSYKFLFNSTETGKTVREVGAAAMSKAMGNRIDMEVLTHHREAVAIDARTYAQDILNSLDIGVAVRKVIIQDVSPPPPTQAAYHEVNSAAQDVEHLINQAEREYSRQILKAYGEADETVSNAKAYSSLIVNRAQGEASRFSQIITEYQHAPEVTRSRLFLETMEEVLSKVPFTLIDDDVNGVLPLLQTKNRTEISQVSALTAGLGSLPNSTPLTPAQPVLVDPPPAPATSAMHAPIAAEAVAPPPAQLAGDPGVAQHQRVTGSGNPPLSGTTGAPIQAVSSGWNFIGWW